MKYTLRCLSAIFLVLFLLPFVHADMGPKPQVDISVYYNNQLVIGQFNSIMLQCYVNAPNATSFANYMGIKSQCVGSECTNLYNLSLTDNECYWGPSPLAWGGACNNGKCNFHYFPPSRFRLGIYVPTLGKIITTPAIDRNNFDSTYDVIIDNDGNAKIKETTSLISYDSVKSFIPAFIITVLLELLVTSTFIFRKRWPKRLLLFVLFANCISLPIVWFIIPLFKIHIPSTVISFLLTIILYEAFAFIFEAYFLYWTNKEFLELKDAFKLSIAMNLISLIVGGILYALVVVFLPGLLL